MSDVQFKSENSPHTQELTSVEQQEITLEDSHTTTSSNQEGFFDVDHINSPIGWNEYKLSESVTFGSTHTKPIDSFMTEDMEKTEKSTDLRHTDTTSDSVHDLIPDMDSAGLWISAASIPQSNNTANNYLQGLNKTEEAVSNINISTPQKKMNSHRLHGIVLCISISTVSLLIYFHPDSTQITSGSNISYNVKIKYSETLTNIENKYNKLYKEIVSNIQNQKTNILNTQESQSMESLSNNTEVKK